VEAALLLAGSLFALTLLACSAFTKGESAAGGAQEEGGISSDGAPLTDSSSASGGEEAGGANDGGIPPGPRFCTVTNPGPHWICEDFDSPDGGIQAAIDKTATTSTSRATIVPRNDAPSTPKALLLEALASTATASVFKSVSQQAVVGVSCSFAIKVLERPSAPTRVFDLQLAAGIDSWRLALELKPTNQCTAQITYDNGTENVQIANCMLRDNEWINVFVDVNPKLPRVHAKVGQSVVVNDTSPPFTMNVSDQVTLQIGPAGIPAAAARVEIDNVVCDRIVP
jgi:hypothetical protein